MSGTKSYGAETLSIASVDHGNDNGDPKEVLTRYNNDPSWDEEISIFTRSIINDEPIMSSSSMDALNTMKLVYKIYHADETWRSKFKITDPEGI